MLRLDEIRLLFSPHKKQITKYWLLLLIVAAAWFYLAAVAYGKNWYGFYPPQVLRWGIVFIPLIFASLALALGSLVLPNLNRVSKKFIYTLLGFSLAVAALLTWLFPPPWPAISQPHTLRLEVIGAMNPASRGAQVEVEGMRAVDGSPISLGQLELSGDWRLEGGRLVSGGEPSSTAALESTFPEGVDLRLNYHRRAGKLLVQLDDTRQEIDLYSRWDTKGNIVLYPPPWVGYSPPQKAFVFSGYCLYFLGIAALVFILGLVFELRLLPSWAERLVLVSFYLFALVFYVGLKHSFANFNAERVYGDTITYVQSAQAPLFSPKFWISERTFTLPLLYKFVGMTPENFTDILLMRRVAVTQTWLSILGWTALGLAVANHIRKKWLQPAAFALILFFSLSLDISLWDRLMYSESVSFSFFALLVAMWLGVENLPPKGRSSIIDALYLVVMIVVTILYSFTRDSNLYLILSGALVFTLAAVLKRTPAVNKKIYLVYLIAVLGLFIFQNMTIRLGNRWQVHVFDNLVRRILFDEQALDYFQAAGLPVTPQLLDLKDMGVFEYQSRLMFSDVPAYKAVREWVDQSGQPTYIRYLLDHPEKSLVEPLRNYQNLINGSNIEYRFPIFPNQPVPDPILASDRRFYLRSSATLSGMALLLLVGIALYWTGRGRRHPAWLVLTALVASIFPLSFIIWNGNPLEIERHTAQIGIQLRLAGWVGLMLVLDWLAESGLSGPAAKQNQDAGSQGQQAHDRPQSGEGETQ